jgi:hypothetical protein
VAVGDFNLDGKPDLATANGGSHTVTILLGTGTGNFTATASPEVVDTTPSWVAVGDFNLDGKPDLVTANAFSNNVTILLGDGTGYFYPAVASPEVVGTRPQSVAVGDFNLDGKPDLATANAGSNNVTILLNTCTARPCPPAFTQPASSPETAPTGPQAVAVGDFNLDGKPDLATPNSQASGNVTILLGNGTGDFNPASTSPEAVGAFPESVAVGDFNLDGKPDLVTGNHASDNVTILLGDGTGNFNPAATSPEAVGNDPTSVAVGDFNLDGKPDLVVTNGTAASITILLGDGTGDFSPGQSPTFILSGGPTSVAVKDFNLDGTPDLAVATSDQSQQNYLVHIMLNDPENPGHFNFRILTHVGPQGESPFSLVVGDFNLDGRPDVATANFFSNNLTILLGLGNGDFDKPGTSPEAVGDSPRTVVVGDFNLDGKPDLATTNLISNNVSILLGDGTGNFTATATSPQPDTGPFALAVGDFNLDGRPDLATGNFLSNNLTILLATCPSEPIGPGITAQPVSQVVGTTTNTKPIATVTHPSQPLQTLAVLISSDGNPFSGSASQNGVTVSGIAVSPTGNVTATVAATCAATNASFTLKVADNSGGSATATLNVTVSDPPPTLNCPTQPVTANTAPGACVANVSFTVTATDNCDQSVSISCQPASGSAFQKGTTTVNCTATDSRQNTSTCSFSVVVTDNEKPQITCPANISVPTTSSCEVVNYSTPTGSDNCPLPAGAVVCTPPSGFCFTPGTTTVNCTVTDASQNQASCSFTVSVSQCTIQCPANITKNTDPNQCQAVVNYSTPTTTGSCGTVTCTPPSGSAFQKGVTTVNCTTQSGPSCSFTVTVNDAQGPTINCPTQPVTANTAPGLCKANVSFNVTATDNCSPSVSVTCQPASGSEFHKGTTTVNCTASDSQNNQSQCSFSVTVSDNENPQLACPANKTQNNDPNQCGAVVNYANTTATDNCPGVGTPTCSPASGAFFSTGTTTVTCNVKDAANNMASCSFTVTVNDTQPPQITCPANITQGTDANQCQAVVNYPAPTVTDNCTAPSSSTTAKKKQQTAAGSGFTVICTPPSGSAFAKGVTTVNCTVADASQNQSSCSFTVTVNDTQAPSIACPANKTQNNDPNQCGAVVSYANATATDNCPGVQTPICTPASGAFFPIGTTTVTCQVSDAAGNKKSCSFTVTVVDTQAPVIVCAANQTALTDSVNDACKVVNFTVTATDNCANVMVVCNPPSGSCFPVGVTTISCTATDASGNTSSCSFTETVFNARLQDDAGGCSNSVLFNTLTGDYRWCCGTTVYTGRGTVTKIGSTYKIEHLGGDRRVIINLSAGISPPSGTATLQSPVGTTRCQITDRDTRNDTCICGG